MEDWSVHDIEKFCEKNEMDNSFDIEDKKQSHQFQSTSIMQGGASKVTQKSSQPYEDEYIEDQDAEQNTGNFTNIIIKSGMNSQSMGFIDAQESETILQQESSDILQNNQQKTGDAKFLTIPLKPKPIQIQEGQQLQNHSR